MATGKAETLVDEVLEFLWRENPVEATIAGVHRYDDMLEKLDLVSRRKKLQQKRDYLARLSEARPRGNLAAEVDHLKSALEVGIHMEENRSSLDRDATTYPRLALYGVYQLVARSTAPYHFRALRAIDRLREIPRVLAEGRLNLSYGEELPHILTIRAVELSARGREYLGRITGILGREVPELKNVIDKYSAQALGAFEGYTEFLIEEVQPRSDGVCAVGGELFEFLLARDHRLEMDAGSLRKLAEEEMQTAEEQLREGAAGLGGFSDWRRALRPDEEPPSRANLLEHWRNVIDEVRGRLRSAGLVTLPAEENLELTPTPEFETSILPVAGYIPPPHFEQDARAYFCVTLPPEDGEGRISPEHCRSNALAAVIRQVYPGRHTFLQQRRRYCGERLSYIAAGGAIEAGWESYALAAAADCGAFDDEPQLRLHALHSRLLSAVRVLADLDLHVEGVPEERAVNALSGQTAVGEKQAWQMVSELAAAPTSSVGALAGRRMIEQWRDRHRSVLGAAFDPKQFHDRMIRVSALPPRMAARRLQRSLDREAG